MELPALLAAAAGAAWGVATDRIAARWPEHEPGTPFRRPDWRTVVVAAAGGLGGALLVLRFGDDLASLAFLAPLVIVLVLLFATDLDQRLLPDILTLPIAPYALLGFVLGVGPFVRTPGDLAWAAAAGVLVPGILFLLSLPFGAGAIGIGDLKLLFGVALVVGAMRILGTVVVGAVAAAAGILVLLAIRRISLKSYIPYGPFLIGAALWMILSPVG